MDIPHPLANEARKWRRKYHVRQSDVAARIGISLSAYTAFELGKSTMHPDHMAALEDMILAEPPKGFFAAPGVSSLVKRRFCETLAAELRLLADSLEAQDFPAEAKARKFVAAIQGYANSLSDYETAIQDAG